MRIEGISAADMAPYYYLEELGLTQFSPKSVEDNGSKRANKIKSRSVDDLKSMADQLGVSENKLMIIRLLERGDIVQLLYFLEKSQLVNAMNLFPREMLVRFINMLPKEIILKMLLWVLPLRILLQCFPTEILLNILRSKRLDVSDMVKNFEECPVEFLRQLMMFATGKNTDSLKKGELLNMFKQMDKNQIMEGFKQMQQKDIFEFIFLSVQKDPELMMQIPREQFMQVIGGMPKPSLVELFQLLPEQALVNFLSQLPGDFLSVAASQLDDNTFIQLLINLHPDLIAQLAGAA